MSETRYTKDHEWIRLDGTEAVVGITDFAQSQLGDVVFVELPEIGRVLEAGKDSAVVESVKAASEVYAPVDGTVSAINDALVDTPALVNEAAQGDGWFYKLTVTNPAQFAELLDEAAYKALIGDAA